MHPELHFFKICFNSTESNILPRDAPVLTRSGLKPSPPPLPPPPPAPPLYPTRVVSQCFHVRGVPTLKLRCPSGHLVNVQQAFYGASSGDVTACGYRPPSTQPRTQSRLLAEDARGEGGTARDVLDEQQPGGNDGHCIQLADLPVNCNGRYHCTVHVTNPYLMNCRTYAIYMQVNYICLPSIILFMMYLFWVF